MLRSGQPPPAFRAPPPTPAALPIALTRPERTVLTATNAATQNSVRQDAASTRLGVRLCIFSMDVYFNSFSLDMGCVRIHGFNLLSFESGRGRKSERACTRYLSYLIILYFMKIIHLLFPFYKSVFDTVPVE